MAIRSIAQSESGNRYQHRKQASPEYSSETKRKQFLRSYQNSGNDEVIISPIWTHRQLVYHPL